MIEWYNVSYGNGGSCPAMSLYMRYCGTLEGYVFDTYSSQAIFDSVRELWSMIH